MKLFRKLFRKEEETVSLYQEEVSIEELEMDYNSLTKEELREKLESSLSGIFIEDASNKTVHQELQQLTSLREIDDRIKQVDRFIGYADQGLYIEVMEHYDKLGDS